MHIIKIAEAVIDINCNLFSSPALSVTGLHVSLYLEVNGMWWDAYIYYIIKLMVFEKKSLKCIGDLKEVYLMNRKKREEKLIVGPYYLELQL